MDAKELEEVRRAQLQMIWAHMRGGTVLATAFALLLAAYAVDKVSFDVVALWLAAKVAVAGARIWQGVLFEREGRPGDLAWRRATYRMLVLDGLVWGIGGMALAGVDASTASLVAGSVVGISCVATFGLQARPIATGAYGAPMLLLTAMGLVARLDNTGLVLGAGLLLVLTVQLRTSVHTERRIVELHRLRLKADAAAAERRHALELAQRESAAKSQFLSNVSHELRTPLHGILGVARLLHVEAPTPAIKKRVELIESSGAHLLRLVNDLIDVGRMHTDRLPLRPRRFELAYELDGIVGLYAVRAEDKSQAFSSELHIERPCWVVGDSARLRQVLHNVLSNAVKYTPVAGRITVTARHEAGQLLVECRDSGGGIAPEDLARIFDAFGQAGREAADATEGTGLGLTIAREVARAMGGDIDVSSTVGVGSVFSIRLALPAVGAEETRPVALPQPPEQVVRRARSRQVLVVEDDDVCALVAKSTLEYIGLRVERVTNGAEAIRHALRETDRPDLVFMDCRMPVMDGYQATREIRSQEVALGLSRVPVIAVTANDSTSLRDSCAEAGMDDLLEKPFASNELYAILLRWLDSGLEIGNGELRSGVHPV